MKNNNGHNKVALILSGNLSKAPYIDNYINILKKEGINYDIFTWNRLGINESGVISFNLRDTESKGYFRRFLNYLKYRSFLKRHIVDYDKVIVFTIAISILLTGVLKKKKYILDIRDYSVSARYLKYYFNKVLKKAKFTIISSKGYLEWLPSNSCYHILHNIPSKFLNLDDLSAFSKPKEINITTIGSIRDYNIQKKLIDSCIQIRDITLRFIGHGPATNKIENYVRTSKIENVKVSGFYNKEDEKLLLSGTTLINNLTANDLNSLTLTTNRFYLSVSYGLPMIVYEDTFQGLLCQQFNLGCRIKRDGDICNTMIEYLNHFNYIDYEKGRLEFQEIVNNEMQSAYTAILNFIKY